MLFAASKYGPDSRAVQARKAPTGLVTRYVAKRLFHRLHIVLEAFRNEPHHFRASLLSQQNSDRLMSHK